MKGAIDSEPVEAERDYKPMLRGLRHLDPLAAKQLVKGWNPGDSAVIELSPQEFAGGIQDYLPSIARWTYEGLYNREVHRQSMPQFIIMGDNNIDIYTARFSYEEIKEGYDDGRTRAILVAPWPDVLPNNIETHLPISGGADYRVKYSLLNKIVLTSEGR